MSYMNVNIIMFRGFNFSIKFIHNGTKYVYMFICCTIRNWLNVKGMIYNNVFFVYKKNILILHNNNFIKNMNKNL